MDIVRVHKHGSSIRTTIPAPIYRALKIAPSDYVVWTWNSAGHAEMRAVPRPHEIAKAAAKRR